MSQSSEYKPMERLPIIDEVGAELARLFRAEEERLARGGRSARRRYLRRSRPLALIAALVLGGTAGALAASNVFAPGTPLEPGTPVVPTRDNGVAIPGSARLLLRVVDPNGGLPWGVRVERTTRAETCIEVGRRAFGEIGVLGQDDEFANDGRFHPLAPDYFGNGVGCANSDAHGHASVDVALFNLPASGFNRGGCRVPPPKLSRAGREFVNAHPLLAHGLASERRSDLPLCPATDLRDVFFGLLGPDAVSVSYLNAAGRLVTAPTAGANGAYLIVLPSSIAARLCSSATPLCPLEMMSSGTGSPPNKEIRGVAYRDHAPCRYDSRRAPDEQTPCPDVGFVGRPIVVPTPAEVASKIAVRRDPPRHGQAQVTVSFASPVAVGGAADYYYFEIDNPQTPDPLPGHAVSNCSPSIAVDSLTSTDYHRGQTVSDTQGLPPCRGTFHGSVTFVLNGDTQDHLPGSMGSKNRLVGDFTIRIP